MVLYALSVSPAGAYLFTPQGGGPTPPTAMGDFDFKNGVYTFNGASVAVSDFFGENPDWGSWNPANIVVGTGFVGNAADGNPVFLGATAAFVLQGATYIVDYIAASGTAGSEISIDTTDLPDFASEANARPPGVDRFGATVVNPPGPSQNTANTGQLGVNKAALTVLFTHTAISLNGGAVTSSDGPGVIPSVVSCNVGDGLTLTRLRIYPMVADADLPALSTP